MADNITALLGRIIYYVGRLAFEFACIFFWASGKFLNAEIEPFYETTWEYEKYVITLRKKDE